MNQFQNDLVSQFGAHSQQMESMARMHQLQFQGQAMLGGLAGVGRSREVPAFTSMHEMQAEVDKWLKDWDK